MGVDPLQGIMDMAGIMGVEGRKILCLPLFQRGSQFPIPTTEDHHNRPHFYTLSPASHIPPLNLPPLSTNPSPRTRQEKSPPRGPSWACTTSSFPRLNFYPLY